MTRRKRKGGAYLSHREILEVSIHGAEARLKQLTEALKVKGLNKVEETKTRAQKLYCTQELEAWKKQLAAMDKEAS